MTLTQKDQSTVSIVGLLMAGYTIKEVAGLAHLSDRTIEAKLNALMEKFGVNRRDHLIGRLVKRGIIHSGNIVDRHDRNELSGKCCNLCTPYTPGVLRTNNKVIFIN